MSLAPFRFRLRLMLLVVALFAVFFAWVGVQHHRQRIRLESELSNKEYIHKLFLMDDIVPGMEDVRKQEVKEIEAEIAIRRQAWVYGPRNNSPSH